MINEITAATTFIALHLPKTVPEVSRNSFRETLAKKLHQKFAAHWDPEVPLRGNAYRSLSFHCGRLDSVILESAVTSDVDASLLKSALPNDFVMWIDPFCVSYKPGEHSALVVIWEDQAALTSAGYPSDSAAAIADLVNHTPPAVDLLNNEDVKSFTLAIDTPKYPDTLGNSTERDPINPDSSSFRRESDKPSSELSNVNSKCASSAPISSAPIVVV